MTSRSEPRRLALPGGGFWLVFPATCDEVSALLRRCFTMVRASFEQAPLGYVVRVGGAPLAIEIHPFFRHAVRIRFRGEQRHRKARLLKALIAKQFRGILPRIRIRL